MGAWLPFGRILMVGTLGALVPKRGTWDSGEKRCKFGAKIWSIFASPADLYADRRDGRR
jgi:hypothetical protein